MMIIIINFIQVSLKLQIKRRIGNSFLVESLRSVRSNGKRGARNDRKNGNVTALLHDGKERWMDELQVRERIDGGGVVQREQHVREHDRPAFGSLLARAGLPRRFTDQHARIGRWNARLPIRRFVKSCSRSTQTLIPVFYPVILPWRHGSSKPWRQRGIFWL